MASSASSSASSSADPVAGALGANSAKPSSPGEKTGSPEVTLGWQRVTEAILGTPGALTPETRARIFDGDDPAELAPLLEKVRRHAYTIVDRDLDGLDVDTVIEAALAAALGEALNDRLRALEAIG